MSMKHRLGAAVRGFRRGVRGLLVASAAVALLGTPARALIITPTFDSSITSDPNAAAIEGGINSAIQTIESAFNDPITVNISFQSMNTGLGESSTFFFNIPYTTYLNALKADATTANDAIALSHLPNSATNPVTNNGNIEVKTANLRAVGIATPGVTTDGTISLNTHITDIGSPGSTLQFSLVATTLHEIDEVLGLGSALPNPPNNAPFPEDLFRYDQFGKRSFTTDSTAKAFFSIDGTTPLAQFDNQNDGGDFGDWQSFPRPTGVAPQVQDAFATAGASPTLGVNEITALDVIGYDAVAVPEPASVSLMAAGVLALAGYGLRRRNRRAGEPTA